MTGKHLQGRVAIVTGATRGIGEAIAERLHQDGATIAVVGREMAAAQAVAARLAGACAMQRDVANERAVEACVADTIASHGRLDIVVNNAGIMSFKPLAEWTKA